MKYCTQCHKNEDLCRCRRPQLHEDDTTITDDLLDVIQQQEITRSMLIDDLPDNSDIANTDKDTRLAHDIARAGILGSFPGLFSNKD